MEFDVLYKKKSDHTETVHHTSRFAPTLEEAMEQAIYWAKHKDTSVMLISVTKHNSMLD